jgi:hypothetical protein
VIRSGTLGAFLVAAGEGSLVTPNIKPTNPIDAFLPATRAIDPGATGFHVYEGIVLSDPQTWRRKARRPLERRPQEVGFPPGAVVLGLRCPRFTSANTARREGQGMKIKEIAEAMSGNTDWCRNSWFAPSA